jgi:ABC-type phosphate transport system ATPase subunit
VTHALRQPRRPGGHVVFLYLGELIEQGPTETIFAEPNDPRMPSPIYASLCPCIEASRLGYYETG